MMMIYLAQRNSVAEAVGGFRFSCQYSVNLECYQLYHAYLVAVFCSVCLRCSVKYIELRHWKKYICLYF